MNKGNRKALLCLAQMHILNVAEVDRVNFNQYASPTHESLQRNWADLFKVPKFGHFCQASSLKNWTGFLSLFNICSLVAADLH